jgi:cell wall-associated NlpC family hydrolase
VLVLLLAALAAPSSASAALHRGDHGAAVKRLQRALHIPADGAFGPQTQRAVKRFQRAHNLKVTGVVGRATARALGLRGTDRTAETADPPAEPTGDAAPAIAAARRAIGSPYASGGTHKSGFDCSGLTMWAFKKAGIKLPHSSYDQYEMGESVDKSDVAAGDLVFFDTSGGGASHVGIATDRTHAISATTHGVMEHSLRDDYWGSHYLGARRLT